MKVLTSNRAPEAVGPYSLGTEVNGLCFFSGMLPINRLTGQLVTGTFPEEVVQVMENIKFALEDNRMDLSNVIKANIYLSDMSKFQVLNEIYGQYFSEPYPARACVAVKTLPKNVNVEIEVIAAR